MLERLDIHSVEPVPGRAYEWVVGEATYAVDPTATGSTRITDLDLVPRSADGRVRFRGDVGILRPTEGGSRRALLTVCNRGTVTMPFSGADLDLRGLKAIPPLGDGLLLDRGWTVVWGGWQWDVERGTGAAGLTAPVVPVEASRLRSEFHLDAAADEMSLGNRMPPLAAFAAYPPRRRGRP